jgi:flagellar basal body-associated protein FliL
MFKTLRWPLATQFTTDRPQYYSVVLYVKTFDQKVEICRRLPAVMDRFYTSFSDSMPANRPARTEEMHALEKEIVSGINALMNDTYVSDASVGRYGTHEFRIAPRPPYCWTPN